MASTMDLELIHDLFTHCIAAAKILKVDEPFRVAARGGPGEASSSSDRSRWKVAGMVSPVRRVRGAPPAPFASLGTVPRQPDHSRHARTARGGPQVARGAQRRGNGLVLGLEDQPLGPARRRRPRLQVDQSHPPARPWRRLSQPLRQPPAVSDGRQLRLPGRRCRDAACRVMPPTARSTCFPPCPRSGPRDR